MSDNLPSLVAGQVVLVDWRGDALPKEPDTLRPAVVIENRRLFPPSFPNVVLVPLTTDTALAIPELTVVIAPTQENGCTAPSLAASFLVASTSKARLRPTGSRVTAARLAAIRQQVGLLVAAVD